jgi:hypothetical protein
MDVVALFIKRGESLFRGGSDSSAYSSPLREPKAPVVPLTEEDGSVSYFFTSDKAAVHKYYNDVEKYDAKIGNSLHRVTFLLSLYIKMHLNFKF